MIFKRTLAIILFCLVAHVGWSQPSLPDPQGDPDAVPLMGIEYLIFAGGAYGVHRFSKRKKKLNS